MLFTFTELHVCQKYDSVAVHKLSRKHNDIILYKIIKQVLFFCLNKNVGDLRFIFIRVYCS